PRIESYLFFIIVYYLDPRVLPSFPTRRSSDLTAPLGGCRESVVIIRTIAAATARLKASVGLAMSKAQLTPMTAAMVLPTRMFQGCARGLAGTANSNTEDAPIGAMYQASKSPRIHKLSKEETTRPSNAPIPQSRRSLSGRTLKFGFRVLSQSRWE